MASKDVHHSSLHSFIYQSIWDPSVLMDMMDFLVRVCVDTVSFRPSQSHRYVSTYGLPHAVLCLLSAFCFISQAPQMESL